MDEIPEQLEGKLSIGIILLYFRLKIKIPFLRIKKTELLRKFTIIDSNWENYVNFNSSEKKKSWKLDDPIKKE